MQNISPSQIIPANNNLTIQILDARDWRLLVGGDPLPAVAANALGLAYSAAFAQARQLSGPLLPAEAIESVMVGWAKEDAAWHLGVMITPEAAIERGGRWCGLARWTDLDGQRQGNNAQIAGRALAEALGKPFQYVPPPAPTANASTDAAYPGSAYPQPAIDGNGGYASAPEVPVELPNLPNITLAKPPIGMGLWALEAMPAGLVWRHSASWIRGRYTRAIFYLVLALIFIVLGIAELNTTFAPVQPDWLPYVGFGVSVVLLLSALYYLISGLTAPAITFDVPLRMIRFTSRARGVTRQIPFEKVGYLLISHATLTSEKLKNEPADSPFARVLLECWLHVSRDLGDFIEIGHVPGEGRAVREALTLPRRPLNLNEIDTPAHQAARLIGETIGTPVLVEDRTH